MICQICHKRPATVHITKIINGVKTEMHICEQCAKEKEELGIKSDMSNFITPFSFSNILEGFMDFPGLGAVPRKVHEEIRCPGCGISYDDFKKTGLFGCSQCYDTFRDRLEPIIKRIHGNTQHTGKVPKRSGGIIRLKRDIEGLKYELKKAVENEEYEKAAQIRDRIKELNNEK